MPGTIQVSILELVGIPSVQSSSTGIKVTVGKQAHVAQEKGDFSFSLASFRDNLNVSVRDSEGNEIAHTAVETRSIVEKGSWDDLFALKGGGHVRMRLQFVLTEDELRRIRSMRESATQKKQEDILKRRHSSADLVYASGGNQVTKMSAGSDVDSLSKDHPSQKRQPTPAFPTSKSAGELDKLVANQPAKEAIQPQDQEKRSPLDKKPSSVRNMVLAFETNPVKEVPPALSKTRRVPQISSPAVVDASMRLPSLKRTIGANAKPAPISEGLGEVAGENEDYPSSISEKQLAEKAEQLKDLKPQNIDYMSSKKDVPIVQPTTEEKKEVKDLEVQNIDYMSSKNDLPKMQTSEVQKEEKQDLKPQNASYSPSKEMPEMQPNREERREEKKELEVQNIDYISSEKDVPKIKPAREEQREEEKDLKLQNIGNMSSEKEKPEMEPNKEGQNEEEKDTPAIQPTTMEEQNEFLRLQNVDYVSSKRDTPKMQPTREEHKGKWDLKLQNIDYMSSKKDLPKMQTIREEAKEDNEGNIDYVSTKKDTPTIQPTRKEQTEENKSTKNLCLPSTAESSRLLLGGLVQAFTSRNNSSTDISTEPQGPLFHEHLVIEKNWRSKHWKSLGRKVKSNVTYGNANYVSDRFHEWIFLDEMISSCIPNDGRPFIDLLEGWLSTCSSGTNQVKITDSSPSPNKNEKISGQRKSLDSGSSSKNGNSKRPFGQAMKIAIMVGFGVLVFLTRQRR